ncbi:MAG: zinc metalloprotease [Bacteroidota bacterium]
MRKISVLLLGALVVMLACNKQEAKPTEEDNFGTETASARVCASSEILEQQLQNDPMRAKRLQDLENKTQQLIESGAAVRLASTWYIPVVVHVVHTNPTIVTDAQIATQLDVLNKDFSRTNAELSNPSVYLAGYSLTNVANCQVRFYLSSTVRKTTTLASFGTNDGVKRTSSGGSDPVNATTKMNMWVCDLSGGLLGYAQFPGGPSATDGVVIDLQGFGTVSTGYSLYPSFNLGRTATHEVGHWLNLRHIWGDTRCGNDLVGDTPGHDDANGGCPATNLKSRCAGKPLEQWMNYMDYTDDRCMYMFTAGQKTRMDAAIDNARSGWGSYTTP